MKYDKVIYILLACGLGLSWACKRDRLLDPDHNPEVAVPILQSSLSVRNMLDTQDSLTFVKEDSSHFLSLVYSGIVFSQAGNDLLSLPNQAFHYGFSLPELKMNAFLLSGKVSLGQVARHLNEPERSDILNAHGTQSSFPDVPQQSVAVFPYDDAPNDIVGVTFSEGTLTLTVSNNLPVEITDVKLELINQSDNSLFATFNFPSIPAYGKSYNSSDLSGMRVTDNLAVGLVSFASPGSASPVTVDTADNIGIAIEGKGLVGKQGIARIPFQYVSSYTHRFNPGGDELLRNIHIKTGKVRYRRLKSDFDTDIELTLRLPHVQRNGVVFERTFPIDAKEITVNLSGYDIDMTMGGNSSNALRAEYAVSSEGNNTQFEFGDSVVFQVELLDLSFYYIDGYLGEHTYDLPLDAVNIGLFNNWKSGHVFFEDPHIEVVVYNSYGIPAQADFNRLRAYDQMRGGTGVDIEGPGVDNTINVKYPNINQVGSARITRIVIDKKTSNIIDILALPPRRVLYDFTANTNPSPDTSANYFATNESQVDIHLNVEFPLHGRIENLVLQDTFAFNSGELHELANTTFYLTTENGFPLDAGVQVYFVDEHYRILDSLITPRQQLVHSGQVDDDGMVTEAGKSQLVMEFTPARTAHIMEAKHLIVRGQLETTGAGQQPVKLYSFYALKVKIGVAAMVSL